MEKLASTAHLLAASQRSANLSAQIAQAAAEDIDAIDEIINRLHLDLFSGRISAALRTRDGIGITTNSGVEIYAVRNLLTERSG